MSVQGHQTSGEGPVPGHSLNTPKLGIQFPEHRGGRGSSEMLLGPKFCLMSFGDNSKSWRGINLLNVFTGAISLVADQAGNNLDNNGSESSPSLPSLPSLAEFRAASVRDSRQASAMLQEP